MKAGFELQLAAHINAQVDAASNAAEGGGIWILEHPTHHERRLQRKEVDSDIDTAPEMQYSSSSSVDTSNNQTLSRTAQLKVLQAAAALSY